MNLPLVSVCTPIYNQVGFVADALTSALEQDYPNLEVIAGDDGSTDGTVQVVMELARKYHKRVIPIVGEPHLGLTGNCNRTLHACRGEYIAFHAGDDILLPGKITAQMQWFEQDQGRVLCGHDVDVFDSDTGRSLFPASARYPLHSGRGAAKVVRNGYTFAGPAPMVKASALPSFGYDARLPVVSDWKLWIDTLAGGGSFGYINGIYARYRRHGSSVTGNDRTLLARARDALVTLALVESSYPHLAPHTRFYRARLFMAMGRWYMVWGDAKSARSYLASALAQNLTVSWKAPLALGFTLLPGRLQKRVASQYGAARRW